MHLQNTTRNRRGVGWGGGAIEGSRISNRHRCHKGSKLSKLDKSNYFTIKIKTNPTARRSDSKEKKNSEIEDWPSG
jgi:hypothetical protein